MPEYVKYFRVYWDNDVKMRQSLKYASLDELLMDLYHELFQKNICLTDVKIKCHYMDIAVTTFWLSYSNGLVLRNEDNCICVTSICPQLSAIDRAYSNKIRRVEPCQGPNLTSCCPQEYNLSQATNYTRFSPVLETGKYTNPQKVLTDSVPESSVMSKPNQAKTYRHTNLLNKAAIAQQTIKQCQENKRVRERAPFDEEFEAKRERERNQRISQNRNTEKIKIFQSDKRSYLQLKEDLEKNVITKEQMNPAFIIKYQIFKLLESRHAIDFTTDNYIHHEYDIYEEFFDSLTEDDDDEEQNIQNISKVYVPHNYNYMSQEKKEEHAKKYKMTLQEFENKYVRGTSDDDAIENYINQGTTGTKKEIINNKKENIDGKKQVRFTEPECTDNAEETDCTDSGEETESTDETDSISSTEIDVDTEDVDLRFLDLINECNKNN